MYVSIYSIFRAVSQCSSTRHSLLLNTTLDTYVLVGQNNGYNGRITDTIMGTLNTRNIYLYQCTLLEGLFEQYKAHVNRWRVSFR